MRDHPQITLAEAIELHLRAMRAEGRAPRSMDAFQFECAHHLQDWLLRPLATLTRHELANRHERLTVASGHHLANRVLHQFRAAYRTAATRFASLPTANPIRRRREPIPWSALPAWRRRVEALSNPVRRDLQFFLLFTGLRSLDARTVRWEDVDFGAGILRRPYSKGRQERAFAIPLATPVLELLAHRRHCNFDDDGWAFPTRARVMEPKGRCLVEGRRVPQLPSPHRLRDTFVAAAREARIRAQDLRTLMNHRPFGLDEATQGHIRPSITHLRQSAEAVATFLLERIPNPT